MLPFSFMPDSSPVIPSFVEAQIANPAFARSTAPAAMAELATPIRHPVRCFSCHAKTREGSEGSLGVMALENIGFDLRLPGESAGVPFWQNMSYLLGLFFIR